jgi:hypothetical protein
VATRLSRRHRLAGPVWALGLLALSLLIGVPACSSSGSSLAGTDRDAVLAYAEPMTDNLLAGFNAGDYATFSRDLNAQMRETLNEPNYTTVRAALLDRIGRYVSREVASVEWTGSLVTVDYKARFEKDDAVTVRVVFETADTHRIAGLWFDSPKLR